MNAEGARPAKFGRPMAFATLGLLLLLLAWDSELTEQMVGDDNAARAAAAQSQGEEHWTELGVGVDAATGQPYVQPIARGKAYRHIRAGLFLVATAQVNGEIFEQSVILLLRHDANGTFGLVLNKPAQLPAEEHLEVSEVIEDSLGTAPRNPRAAEVLLAGGPVGLDRALYLHDGVPAGATKRRCYADRGGGTTLFVDSNGQPLPTDDGEAAAAVGEEIVDGVFFLSSPAFLRCALRDKNGPRMRVFLGHAGWGAQQLDGEWRRGDWMLCKATADLVFASDVAQVWEALSFGSEGVTLCSQVPQSEHTWSERRDDA